MSAIPDSDDFQSCIDPDECKLSIEKINHFSETAKALKTSGAALETFMKTINVISNIANFAGSIGTIVSLGLTIAGMFVPDTKHEEIMNEFNKIHKELSEIRQDIAHLGNEIKWDLDKGSFLDTVNRIKLAIEYNLNLGQAKDITEKKVWAEKLKSVCSGEELHLALTKLSDGLASETSVSINILDSYFDYTEGYLNKIIEVADFLLKLFFGGLVALMANECLLWENDKAARDVAVGTLKQKFNKDCEIIASKVQSVIRKCMDESYFGNNFLKVMKQNLANKRSNQHTANDIINELKEKYDFLHLFCASYDEQSGFDNHCIAGNRVEIFRTEGKCVLLFYHLKSRNFRHGDSMRKEVLQAIEQAGAAKEEKHVHVIPDVPKPIISTTYSIDAQGGFAELTKILNGKGREMCHDDINNPGDIWGMFVINGQAELHWQFNFDESQYVYAHSHLAHWMVLLD